MMRTTIIPIMKPLLALLLLIILSGCASTTPKDAYSASTVDILFTDSVQKYLANRRLQLEQLQFRSAELDDKLLMKIGELRALEQELNSARTRTGISDRELSELQSQVAAKKAEAEKTFQKSTALQIQMGEMKQQQIATEEEQKADVARINELNQEIATLEQEEVILDRAIERNLNLKAEQILRSNGTN